VIKEALKISLNKSKRRWKMKMYPKYFKNLLRNQGLKLETFKPIIIINERDIPLCYCYLPLTSLN